MATLGGLYLFTPEDGARKLGERAQERRLAFNLTRRTLALRSGVPSSSIRKFETTGQIGLVSMLKLAQALQCMDEIVSAFPEKEAQTLEEFVGKKRKRGSQ